MRYTKQFWIVFFIAFSLLGFTGCNVGSSTPISGVVVEKDYDKPKRVYRNKKWKKIKADWDITVQDSFGEKHEIDVSESKYNSIRIGDRFTEGNN